MASIEEELERLDQEASRRVEDTLRSINIALKLNAARLKAGTGSRIPAPLARLQEWKRALEFWKEVYGQPYGQSTRDTERMAERLGQLYSICADFANAT